MKSAKEPDAALVSCLSWECKKTIQNRKLIEAITETFIAETDDIQSELCGYVFKVEYTERKNGFLIYACIMGRSIYGIPCCCQKRKIKITEMCIPSNGEIVPLTMPVREKLLFQLMIL